MPQASDLGYLLHKHPDRVQTFTLTASTAYVFYPEATDESCTVALLLDIDPLALMRNQRGVRERFTLGQHVNDKVYVASSLMSVALGKAFSTALSGRCNARPELVDQPIPSSRYLRWSPSRSIPGSELVEPDLDQRFAAAYPQGLGQNPMG